MAKKTQLNVSIGVDAKGYAKSWDEVIKITQEGGSDVEKEAAKMALAVAKKIENMTPKQQARQLENLTVKMVNMGLEGTKAFGMVASSAGKLKAEIDDAKGVIDAMRPDAPFNALNTTLGASAQAFAGVQGAMALFGSESEDLQKTLVKVQGAMALAEGFKAIDGLTDGFQQLNLVIKQNPLIAGASIFAAATAAIIALTNATSELEVKQNALRDITNKAYDATISEKVELQRLLKVYNDKNTTDAERLRIQKTLVEKYPEYLGQISTENVEQKKVNAGLVGYIKLLDLSARAQASKELYIEALKEERKLSQEYAKDQMKLLNMGANPLAKFFLEETGMATGNKKLEEVSTKVKTLKGEYESLTSEAEKAAAALAPVVTPDKPTGGGKSGASNTKVSKPAAQAGFSSEEFFGGKFNATTGVTEYTAAVQELTTSLDNLGRTADALPDNFAGITAANAAAVVKINEANAAADAQIAKFEMQKASADALAMGTQQVFDAMGQSMAASFDTGSEAMNAFAGAMIQTVTKLIGMALSNALANAIVGGTQAGTATGPAAPFTTPAFIATAIGGVMAAFATIPKFETGGVVGGNSYHGDKILARVNSGELILNGGQQRAVLAAMSGGGYMAETKISGRDLAIVLKKYNIDNSRG